MPEPTKTPMTGAQRRSAPAAFSAMPAMTATTSPALSGAASAGLPSGTSASRSNTAGITVTGISMMTVPETVGVSTRWNSESRTDIATGTKEETRTRVASSAGPPAETAEMQTEMNAAEAATTTR